MIFVNFIDSKRKHLRELAEEYTKDETDETLRLVSMYSFMNGFKKAEDTLYTEEETLYTEEQVEDLIKKAITETANAYLEWIKNETDIIDKETKEADKRLIEEFKMRQEQEMKRLEEQERIERERHWNELQAIKQQENEALKPFANPEE